MHFSTRKDNNIFIYTIIEDGLNMYIYCKKDLIYITIIINILTRRYFYYYYSMLYMV